MPHWYAALLAYLAAQPAETVSVTRTLVELEALASGPRPPTAVIRGYWRGRAYGVMGYRLRAIGWRVRQMRGRPPTLPFVRRPPDAPAESG